MMGNEEPMGKGFYNTSHEEIDRQNRIAIRYFAYTGLPVAVANVVAQSIVQGVPAFTPQNLLLLGYFFLLLLIERFALPRYCKNATFLVYAFEAPVMIISILLGTIWDPTHQAITFPMFMSVIPIFILDKPQRVIGVSFAWSMLFVLFVSLFKDPLVQQSDYVHTAEFFFVSFAVTIIVLRLRFDVVHNLERANYHLGHDVLTDTQNRLSLEKQSDRYMGSPIFVAVGAIDHYELINDFYGSEASEGVLTSFAMTLKDIFGQENTYRISGNELLCICEGESDELGYERIQNCQQHMLESHFEPLHIDVTCSFGAVTAKPSNSTELISVIQLATIYAHESQRKGEGKYTYEPFDVKTLQNAIARSNTGMHANSYEINHLTGLPAMSYFVVHTAEVLNHVADSSRRPHIGFVNITQFRSYNEKYGYTKGDDLIVLLAHLLQDAFPNRHVAHITGSKFCIMCYLDEIGPGISSISDDISRFNPEEALAIRAGFAEYHEGDSINSLLDKARIARKYVEPHQKQRWRIYDEELDEQIKLSQFIVNHLDQAIEEDWLKVYYQPIVWCSNHKPCNLEALSRWIDPVHGMLSPAQFIPPLEKAGLIYKLSLHVIRQAFKDMRRMRDMGLPLVPISVNLSRKDFFARDMVEEVTTIADESGLPRNLICLEITESAVAHSMDMLRHEVDRFHERGFSVWMDDFGSEYSTLNILEELNFDLVKLDMNFMRHFTTSDRNAVIVSSVIEMCMRLGIETLMEGVEEMNQAELLQQMGNDKLQGFLFSRPLPFDELVAYLSRAYADTSA